MPLSICFFNERYVNFLNEFVWFIRNFNKVGLKFKAKRYKSKQIREEREKRGFQNLGPATQRVRYPLQEQSRLLRIWMFFKFVKHSNWITCPLFGNQAKTKDKHSKSALTWPTLWLLHYSCKRLQLGLLRWLYHAVSNYNIVVWHNLKRNVRFKRCRRHTTWVESRRSLMVTLVKRE